MSASRLLHELLAKPLPTERMHFGDPEFFDPWDLFPSLYGSYSSAFDDCAIQVLEDISNVSDDTIQRDDLASQMLREMLCTAGICGYGISPRACFPAVDPDLFQSLIDKWKGYYAAMWDQPYVSGAAS